MDTDNPTQTQSPETEFPEEIRADWERFRNDLDNITNEAIRNLNGFLNIQDEILATGSQQNQTSVQIQEIEQEPQTQIPEGNLERQRDLGDIDPFSQPCSNQPRWIPLPEGGNLLTNGRLLRGGNTDMPESSQMGECRQYLQEEDFTNLQDWTWALELDFNQVPETGNPVNRHTSNDDEPSGLPFQNNVDGKNNENTQPLQLAHIQNGEPSNGTTQRSEPGSNEKTTLIGEYQTRVLNGNSLFSNLPINHNSSNGTLCILNREREEVPAQNLSLSNLGSSPNLGNEDIKRKRKAKIDERDEEEESRQPKRAMIIRDNEQYGIHNNDRSIRPGIGTNISQDVTGTMKEQKVEGNITRDLKRKRDQVQDEVDELIRRQIQRAVKNGYWRADPKQPPKQP
ncbi:hypothetical protein PTKIN_Ptkin19aG0134900 [Pterospermum kingtungense]